ncbi:hypothetical protein LJR220_003328 [Bradyrhizobium sp. LjRoot220]|uniref:baseplate hub protein n=1 Tax=Bradyrhizobium sp. LjRoot220 TaxID=3342284 RepID=UPI003ECC9FEE
MALEQRLLNATISLASGSFTEGGNTAKLPQGLRMSAVLQNAGGLSDGTLNLTIYGMTRSLMNQLSTLGIQVNLVPKNPITLTAGTAGKMSTAFTGYIIAAFADYNASPEVAFHITAHTLAAYGAAPAEASSFKGSADVATIMAGFATKMGLRFENAGVTTKLSNPYFSGSLRDQARACVKAAGISWNGGELGLMSIWPKNGSRAGQVPVIAPPPRGSMIGYPTYTAYGIMLRNLYEPTIGLGQKVSVESSVLTKGEWQVYSLAHQLECAVPRGKWETTIMAYNPKHPTPVR